MNTSTLATLLVSPSQRIASSLIMASRNAFSAKMGEFSWMQFVEKISIKIVLFSLPQILNCAQPANKNITSIKILNVSFFLLSVKKYPQMANASDAWICFCWLSTVLYASIQTAFRSIDLMGSAINAKTILLKISRVSAFLLTPIVNKKEINFVSSVKKILSPTPSQEFASSKIPIAPHFLTKIFAYSVIYNFTTTSILKDA